MKSSDSTRKLRSILGDLSVADTDEAASLERLKPLLARAVRDGRLYGLAELGSSDADVALAQDADVGDEVDRLLAAVPAETALEEGQDSGPMLQARDLFARLPFALSPDNQPRLSNLRADSVIGPIRDRLNRPIVIEIFSPVRKLIVKVAGSPEPWMLLTQAQVPQVPAASGTRVRIRRGTVWVLARALAPAAPAGAYVGFSVDEGVLEFSAAPAIAGDTLTTGSPVKVSLQIKQTIDPDPDLAVTAPPPAELTFKWSAGGVTVDSSDGAASIGPTSFEFKPDGTLRYDGVYRQVVLGYRARPREILSSVLSADTFEIDGTADLAEVGWAVPITVAADPLSLPEADGLRVWTASLSKAVTARWLGGPTNGIEMPAARLMIWRDGCALVDQAARRLAPSDAHKFSTWRLPESAHHAGLDAKLDATFRAGFGTTSETGPFVFFGARCATRFDRPLDVAGAVVSPDEEPVGVLLQGESGAQSVQILATGLGATPAKPWRRRMFALENAYLASSTPRFVGLMGKLVDGTAIVDARAALVLPVAGWVPTLPDPYVGNFSVERRALHNERAAVMLLGFFAWEQGEASFGFVGSLSSAGVVSDPQSTRPSGPASSNKGQAPSGGQTAQGADASLSAKESGRAQEAFVGFMRDAPQRQQQIDRAEGRFVKDLQRYMPPISGFMLLDVSTARHQVGVQIGTARWGDDNPTRAVGGSGRTTVMNVAGMRVGTQLSNIRVFSLPQIQWEPVRTLEKDQDPITLGIFPTPLASANDGGASVMGANVATLVPAIPDLTLEGLVSAHSAGEGVVVVTTLPFGMRALIRLQASATTDRAADRLDYVQPSFSETSRHSLKGALQLALTAQGGSSIPGLESPSFVGVTVQTLNGVDLASGAPLGISVLGATVGSDGSVESLFNNEFAGARPRVPVTRYDWCGYGASTFSDWSNPKGAFAETTKAQFQVMVGRTALEVIKVSSVLYPWGIRLTRSVTVERRGGGGVIRRDSGWQALGPGLFDFTSTAQPAQPYEIHPGLIRGVFDVDRVRPLAQDAIDLPGGGAVLPMAFDAEIAIDGLPVPGRTRATGLVGFLHIKPVGNPLSVADFAELIRRQGAIGGPIDAMFEVGGSRLRARALRAEVGVSAAGGSTRFVGAVRATPEFGPSGAWSVVQGPGPASPDAAREMSAVLDGAPIVRAGAAQPGDGRQINAVLNGPYRFADPSDLFAGASPATDYGFLQADTTHRFLFRRPTTQAGVQRVESVLPPAFADFFAATTSKGLFPPLANTIELTDRNYRLDVNPASGYLRLSPSVDFPSPRGDLVLSDNAADAIRVNYSGARLQFQIGERDWSVAFDRLELWTDLSFLQAATGTRLTLKGATGRKAQLDRIETLMHPTIEDIVSVLPMMNSRGVHGPIDLGATNAKLACKISAGVDKYFSDPAGIAAVRFFALIDLVGEHDLSPPPPPPPGPITGPGTLSGGGGFDSGYLALRVGYEARFSIRIAAYPVAVLFGWGMELGGKLVIGGADAGKVKGLVELSFYIGLAFGKKLGPFEATVATGAGLLIQQEGTAVGVGGFIFLEIKAEVEPVVTVKVYGEFACLQVDKSGEKYHKWMGEIGINVSLFMIISIKFAANVSDEKKVT